MTNLIDLVRQIIHAVSLRLNHSATFEEFLKYYVSDEKMNEHWELYNNLVIPCTYNYKYILKLEDIDNESNWLFKEWL